MKTYFKIGMFAGGAPRSILQIIKSNRSTLGEVVVDGEFDTKVSGELVAEFQKETIRVIKRDKLYSRIFLQSLKEYLSLYRDIKAFECDLLIVTGDYYLCQIIALVLDIPMVLIRAGGVNNFLNKKSLLSFRLFDSIVFSDETRNYLLNNSVPDERISLYRNRILCEQDQFWLDFYKKKKTEIIDLLVISRLDNDKIFSVIKVIDVFERISKICPNVRLLIAGDGKYFNMIQERVFEVNNQQNINIALMLGHVVDIQSQILKSSIVFGKGRSVIEPLMMNRVGVVVSEKGDFFIVKENNYCELRSYNFSGRSMKNPMGENELIEIINTINDGCFPYENIQKVAEMARRDYHVNYNKEVFRKVIENNLLKKRQMKYQSEFRKIIFLVSRYTLDYFNLAIRLIYRKTKNLVLLNKYSLNE